MRMLEHEGRSLFEAHGIPVQDGRVVQTVDEAAEAANFLGYPVMVKAQVFAGGRGKAGGIKRVEDEKELRAAASVILGMTIKDELCHSLLITRCATIEKEFYVGITLDAGAGYPVLMFSTEGGMDIETVAAEYPEKLLRMLLTDLRPLGLWHAMNFLRGAALPSDCMLRVARVVVALSQSYFAKEAITMEINPLAVTAEGAVIALDAKVVLDNDALARLGIPKTDGGRITELEKRAAAVGVRYVQLDGDIAVLGGGAGVGMATMDLVHFSGHKPACFIDCGGGITSEATAEALRICLDTPGAKGVIFNAFGGGNNCETMGLGVLMVAKERPEAKIMVKMRGHSQDEGWELLAKHGVPFVRDETSTTAVNLLIKNIYGA